MDKDEASVPLADLNSSTPHHEVKPNRPKSRSKNSVIFKILFLVLISILIVLLVTTLIIVILRYQSPNSTTPSTTGPPTNPPIPERVRIPNKFWNEYYLPKFIQPKHYSLTLQLLNTTYNISEYNLTSAFYGKVEIHFHCFSKTKFVVLHVNYLTIQSIVLKKEFGSDREKILDFIYDSFYNYMIVLLDKPLTENQTYVFDIKYQGVMTTDKSGIISTIYTDVVKKKKFYILYSKLEPIGARRLCPCFDEPDKKSTYSVSIIHETKYQALSNMPLNSTSSFEFKDLIYHPKTGWNETISLSLSQFNKTEIPMSIYLLAFALIDNYNHKDIVVYRKPEEEKLIRIWFPNDLLDSVEIPLNYSRFTEDFFERYFNYTSPLPKTDHIYIPDFLSGAMENWGLITYRDRHLLVPSTNTAYQSKTSLLTIAHELAHFWFGNWITTKTWGEIWLNEGFATYFASFAYYKLIGMNETKAEELFLYERRQILTKDTRSNLNSVITSVTDPLTFKSVFNSITYYKGQVLLVWLESIMGPSGFTNAIKTYITRFAQKNPTTDDFFEIIDEYGAAKTDFTNIGSLKMFFYPWLHVGGYPIVTVNYNIQEQKLILTQKSVLKNSSETEKWPIYITYRSKESKLGVSVYFSNNKTIQKNLKEEDNDFVIFNSNGKSYLRVNYSELLWERIIRELNSSNCKITAIEKIILFDDAFYFAENNNIGINITKGLIDSFQKEIDPIPWLIFYYRVFDRMFDLFKDDILFIKFSDYVVKLSKSIVENAMKSIGNDDLNLIEDIHQRSILTMSCDANNQEVLNWMSTQFKNWIKYPGTTKLPKHLARPILFYGMRTNDNKANWMKLWNMLINKKERGTLLDDQIAVGLAGTTKPFYLYKLLNYYLTSGTHRSNNDKNQEFSTVVDWISKSTGGIIVLQRWILRNSVKIMKFSFGDNLLEKEQVQQLGSLILKLCKSIYEPHLITPLLNLIKKSSDLTKTIAMNNEWRETTGKRIMKIFQK